MVKKQYFPTLPIGLAMDSFYKPIFWDPHTSVVNNKKPLTIITGESGSGKTFFGSMIMGHSAMMGKRSIVVDPKGDFLSLLNLQQDGYIDKINVIDITEAKPGVLDPFYMTKNEKEKINIVTGFIDTVSGGLSDEQQRVLNAYIKEVLKSPNPSLSQLVNALRGSNYKNPESRKAAKNLGGTLYSISELQYANVIFGHAIRDESDFIDIGEGLTIITLAGLKLPDSNKVITEYTQEERLSTGVLFLIVDLLHRILNSQKEYDDTNKIILTTIMIDEANIVVSSREGARIIEHLGNMGRSKKVATILMSQNNSHFSRLNIDNAVSSRFTFAIEDEKDARTIVTGMALDKGAKEEEVKSYVDQIAGLQQGEVIMRDIDKRSGKVKIHAIPQSWLEALARPVIFTREEN